VNAKIKAATSIKIEDTYGRTCNGPYFAVGGTQKESIATGLKVDAWNGTATQTMTGITISATCADRPLTQTAISCPNITVKDPDAMCEYVASMCNGIAITQVKTAAQNVSAYNSGAACFYATVLTDLRGAIIVNGEEYNTGCEASGVGWGLPLCSKVMTDREKVDGGYYVYVSGYMNQLTTSNSNNGLHANCK